jgi:hypothetical protein
MLRTSQAPPMTGHNGMMQSSIFHPIHKLVAVSKNIAIKDEASFLELIPGLNNPPDTELR